MERYKKYGIRLCAVLMITLTACGSNETGIQVVEEKDVEPLYLSFFSPQSMSDSDVAKYWSDRFTEQYNEQVYIEFDNATYYADEGFSYRELLEKRLESSAPDDLYIINAEDVLEFEKKGYWMDLSDMDFVDNLTEKALYQSTYNGKVFSVPLSFTGFGFVWNLDLLESHDLEIPQNLEEFLKLCEKLKREGILPYGASKGYSLTVPVMCVGLSRLYGSGNQEELIADLNSGKTQISEYLREGYEFLDLMIEKGYLDPEQAMAAAPGKEDVELFLNGECAFICTALGNLHKMENDDFRMELTGLPVLEDGVAAVYGASRRLCVNPESKNLETALQFIEMLGDPEALAESAALEHGVSSSNIYNKLIASEEQKLAEQLQQPGQIPNQDFSLHF